MSDVQNTKWVPIENKLVDALLAYQAKHGLSLQELAKRADISALYLLALLRGDRPIQAMDLKMYRRVGRTLGISAFSAMMLAGALTADDFGTPEPLAVSPE